MAQDKLNISGWDSGWPTGFVTNVDESIAGADGSSVSTTIEGDVVVFDLDASNITDVDVVTNVAITIRARLWPKFQDGSFIVELLIGGASQGAEGSPPNLGSIFQNGVYGYVGWNVDWTAAQLDGMQVRVTTVEDLGTVEEWFIDCMDVDVTYTPVDPHVAEPAAATLTLSGDAPDIVELWAQPAAATPALTGQAPTLDTAIAVSSTSLGLAGKPSYLNPQTLQLQPNGWDNGWPFGFITNIDEPTSAADGSTISTNVPLQSTRIDFDSVLGIIDPLDTVLGIEIVARVAYSFTPTDPPGSTPRLQFGLYLDDVGYGGQSQNDTDVLTNQTYSMALWQQDWSVQQLETLQVSLGSSFWLKTVDDDRNIVDCIDVIITYVPQTPILVQPPAGDLTTASAAPTVEITDFNFPASEALILAGQAVIVEHTDGHSPFPARRDLVPAAPTLDASSYPAEVDLALSVKTPTAFVENTVAPAVDTLALAGKIPTLLQDSIRTPADQRLLLATEAPLRQRSDETTFYGPGSVSLTLLGYDVDLAGLRNFWIDTPAGAGVLAGYASTLIRGVGRAPTEGTLTLTGQALAASRGNVDSVTEGTAVLNGYAPAAVSEFLELTLTGYQPTKIVDHLVVPAVTALSLTGQAPRVADAGELIAVGELQLDTYAPTTTITSTLTPGQPGLISLTVDRNIEFIATPTIIEQN